MSTPHTTTSDTDHPYRCHYCIRGVCRHPAYHSSPCCDAHPHCVYYLPRRHS